MMSINPGEYPRSDKGDITISPPADGREQLLEKDAFAHAESIKNSTDVREKEILASGLNEFFVGYFCGMAVFEGRVAILDDRSKEPVEIQTRIILSRDFPLEKAINTQHSQYSEVNNTLLATQFFDSIYKPLNNLIGIRSPKKGMRRSLVNIALCKLIDLSNGTLQEEPQVLTVVHAHGGFDDEVGNFVFSGQYELHTIDHFLDSLSQTFHANTANRLPVLFNTCFANFETGKIGPPIDHNLLFIVYRHGFTGLIDETGKYHKPGELYLNTNPIKDS